MILILILIINHKIIHNIDNHAVNSKRKRTWIDHNDNIRTLMIHNDLPPVEHLYFPLVFSLDGNREKGMGKVRYDSVCALRRGPRPFINWIT